MYFLLGICLILAFLLALNIFASASSSLLWSIISKPAKKLSSRKQEQLIFGLRTFPVVAALVFVLAFLIPAYVLYEPDASGEIVTAKMAIISLACLLGIAVAGLRVLRTWSATRRLSANWLRHSRLITVDDVHIPIYQMQHPFPVIAVVGMLRPRLFVAEQVFGMLSNDEFRAAIAHEYGHMTAHDNLKRAFLGICRDTLIFPVGRKLDIAWAENVEAAADEYAAQVGGKSTALDLAEALIKVARIVPANTRPAMPLGSYLIGSHERDLKDRIERLLAIAGNNKSAKSSELTTLYSMWPYPCIVVFGMLLLLLETNLLLMIHNVTEYVVALLQ